MTHSCFPKGPETDTVIGPTTGIVRADGKLYDAKAVIGAAHGYQHSSGPLKSSDFASSETAVKKKLEGMGFEIEDRLDSGKSLYSGSCCGAVKRLSVLSVPAPPRTCTSPSTPAALYRLVVGQQSLKHAIGEGTV